MPDDPHPKRNLLAEINGAYYAEPARAIGIRAGERLKQSFRKAGSYPACARESCMKAALLNKPLPQPCTPAEAPSAHEKATAP